jgi:hypothetical protein
MPFTVAVWSAGRKRPFGITVTEDSVTYLGLGRLIQSDPSGHSIGFVAAVDWLLFPATVNGEKKGTEPFEAKASLAAPPGGELDVWVERDTAPGEPCGGVKIENFHSSRSPTLYPPRFLLHPLAGVVVAPQTGKSNPHARDAGARAWRETETPPRFRRPLVRRRCRSHEPPRPPCLFVSPRFGIAGGPVGAGGGAGAGAGGEASSTADESSLAGMMQQVILGQRGMAASIETLVRQQATPDVVFSEASRTIVDKLLRKRGIPEGSTMGLPRDIAEHMPPAPLDPYEWGRNEKETSASPLLMARLKEWVTRGAEPPILQAFVDVQKLAANASLVIEEPGVGKFTGMSDMVVLRSERRSDVVSVVSSCALAVDWKTPTAMAKDVNPQALLQVLAIHELNDDRVASPPVFFTDLHTGFYCWQVVSDEVHSYRGASGVLLSLAEGVALIRYLLQAEARQEEAHMREVVALRDSDRARAAIPPTSHGPSAPGGSASSSPPPTGKGSGGGASASGSPDDPSSCPSTCTSPADEIASAVSIARSIMEQWVSSGGVERKRFFSRDDSP